MIFEDPSQKRWKVTRFTFGVGVGVFVILLGILLASMIVNPLLPGTYNKKFSHRRVIKGDANLSKLLKKENAYTRSTTLLNNSFKMQIGKISTSTTSLAQLSSNGLLSTAFLVQDDPESVQSFKDHSSLINIVFPDWYFVASSTCGVDEREDKEITKTLQTSNVAIFPRIANFRNEKWSGEETGKMLKNIEARDCLAQTIGGMIASTSAQGINIDFENLKPEDKEPFLEFLISLTDVLHKQNKLVTVDVPAHDEAYDLQYISKITDGVVVMSYDEHYAGGDAGPIASENWFEDTLTEVAAEVPANKLIVALGAYSYDWTADAIKPAKSMGFNETMNLAREIEAQPEMDSVSKNMFFAYQDDNNKQHQVWFLNGVTAWNQYSFIKSKNALGFGLWRLGTEDPTFWKINQPNITAQDFKIVPALTNVYYENEGELFRVKAIPSAGNLDITTDDDGDIDYAQYQALPSGYVMDQVGNNIPNKNLVLTFDDGPDPVWTPQILAILEKEKVPATFFIVGDQAQRYPGILGEMAKNGFLVGNHTYNHPDIMSISDSRLKLELNRTERYIEAEYGKKTALFRSPYNTDTVTTDLRQLHALDQINQLGYIIAGANIDSDDWQRPGVEKIVNNVLSQLGPDNHVIVMHDSGGDRSQTITALKILIPKLRSEGYSFVSFSQASGINNEVLMPKMEAKEWLFIEVTRIFSALKNGTWQVIVWLFFFTTVIAILRILFMGTIVLRSAKRGIFYDNKNKIPDELVSVIIPAYNEEKTIAKTLDALKPSTYKNIEILVINDGSTDQTSEMVKICQQSDARIRLIEKINGGKSSAANLGLEEARGEIVVMIDADTILYPFTIMELIKPFADGKVDAVCGNVEVGNVHNLLTGFQSLEYITSQNFDRRAFDELNCISVVPGATGAWRKARIIKLGGYTDDTLTEDADLTLRLLLDGGRIVYAPEARSRTEAPETVSALAKQRFRWSYGTFQCLRKNTKSFFHGTLGWVALPNMFMFQILFPLLSPIGDLVLILAIINGNVGSILAGYLMFVIMDLFGSLLAFTLEKRSKKLMWLVLIQRFFYRQFMYYITYKSIIAILRGRKYGWNKLERTGTVKA